MTKTASSCRHRSCCIVCCNTTFFPSNNDVGKGELGRSTVSKHGWLSVICLWNCWQTATELFWFYFLIIKSIHFGLKCTKMPLVFGYGQTHWGSWQCFTVLPKLHSWISEIGEGWSEEDERKGKKWRKRVRMQRKAQEAKKKKRWEWASVDFLLGSRAITSLLSGYLASQQANSAWPYLPA